MEDQYNLIEESWIEVVTLEGDLTSYCIKDLLLKAHQIREIYDSSPLMKYGVYRFLIAFISDAFNIAEIEDIEKLIEAKNFSSDIIDVYCKAHFEKFFLFSDKYPFYQNPNFDEKSETKPITELLQFFFPKGNNTILFYHKLQKEHTFSPLICARALCALPAFAVSGGRGYKPSINGKPPWYVLIKGKNLFETLVLNSCGTPIELNTGKGGVLWKSPKIEYSTPIQMTSTLQGLTWLPRYIHLIPAEGGNCTYTGKSSNILVSELKIKQGWSFTGKWTDPHISYILSEKYGRSSLKLKEGKKIWRDLGPLLLIPEMKAKYEIPKVVSQFQSLKYEDTLPDNYLLTIEIYGLRTDKAKFIEWNIETLSIPLGIARNSYKRVQIQPAIDFANKVESVLYKSLIIFSTKNNKKNDIIYNRLKYLTIFEYWTQLEAIFKGKFLQDLENQDEEDVDASGRLQKEWKTDLRILSKKVLETFLGEMSTNAEFLKKQVETLDYFSKIVYSILFPKKISKSKSKRNKPKI